MAFLLPGHSMIELSCLWIEEVPFSVCFIFLLSIKCFSCLISTDVDIVGSAQSQPLWCDVDQTDQELCVMPVVSSGPTRYVCVNVEILARGLCGIAQSFQIWVHMIIFSHRAIITPSYHWNKPSCFLNACISWKLLGTDQIICTRMAVWYNFTGFLIFERNCHWYFFLPEMDVSNMYIILGLGGFVVLMNISISVLS